MKNSTGSRSILTSKQDILDYANISKHVYAKLIKMGMPVLYLDKRCLAHGDNIDDFFKKITSAEAISKKGGDLNGRKS